MAEQDSLAVISPSLSNLSNRLRDLEGKMIVVYKVQSAVDKLDDVTTKIQNVAAKLDNVTSRIDTAIIPKLDSLLQQISGMLAGPGKTQKADNQQQQVADGTWLGSLQNTIEATSKADTTGEMLKGYFLVLDSILAKIAGYVGIYKLAKEGINKFSGRFKEPKENLGSGVDSQLEKIATHIPTSTTADRIRNMNVGGLDKKGSGLWLPNKSGSYEYKPIEKKAASISTSPTLANMRGPNSAYLPSNSLIAYANQMPKAAKAVDGLTRSQRMLNTVMNANPIGRLIQLGTLLYENWDTIKAVLGSVWAAFEETFPGLAKIVETYVGNIIEFWTQLPDNIMAALSSVYEIITGAFGSAFEWLSEKFSWIQGAWNSLFGGGNKAGGAAPGDVYSYARGGIVMNPILTTFAEEGPEAAIPLDGSSRAVSLWYTAGRMLGMFDGQQQPSLGSALPAFRGDGANQGIVVSAPINITINGNADSNTVQQVQQAAQAALMDLKRQLKELQWQERRVSFD
jgi:hypothetical protein